MFIPFKTILLSSIASFLFYIEKNGVNTELYNYLYYIFNTVSDLPKEAINEKVIGLVVSNYPEIINYMPDNVRGLF